MINYNQGVNVAKYEKIRSDCSIKMWWQIQINLNHELNLTAVPWASVQGKQGRVYGWKMLQLLVQLVYAIENDFTRL